MFVKYYGIVARTKSARDLCCTGQQNWLTLAFDISLQCEPTSVLFSSLEFHDGRFHFPKFVVDRIDHGRSAGSKWPRPTESIVQDADRDAAVRASGDA